MHECTPEHEQCVDILLQHGACVTATRPRDLKTAVHLAAESGRKSLLEKLLHSDDFDIDLSPEGYPTPLISAAIAGESETLKVLLEKGADVHYFERFGDNALLGATHKKLNNKMEDEKRLSCVKQLIKHCASVNVKDYDGRTPLIKASISQYPDIVKLLIEYDHCNVDLNAVDDVHRTALSWACQSKNYSECAYYLINAGCSLNIPDCTDKKTALIYAAQCNNYNVMITLLKAGAGVNLTLDSKKQCIFDKLPNDEIRKILFIAGYRVEDITYQKYNKCLEDLEMCNADEARNVNFLVHDKNTNNNNNSDMNQDCTLRNVSSLMSISRRAVRSHLTETHPENNLYCLVPKLNIPPLLHLYLVYNMVLSLKEKEVKRHHTL